MNELTNILFLIFLSLLIFDFFLFLLSVALKKQDIADVFWGIKFIIISLVALLLSSEVSIYGLIIFFIVLIWGVRLSIHIGLRNLKKGEDPRYKEISKDWGSFFYPRSFLQNFVFQSILAIAVTLPVINTIIFTKSMSNVFLFFGLLIWAFGFMFEVISDLELKRFLRDKQNKGKIMQAGLWAYSRHPNYFGEIVLWWGIYIISIQANIFSIINLIGPITITLLIVFVSGIPPLERKYKDNKEYQSYARKVSILIPLPTKK